MINLSRVVRIGKSAARCPECNSVLEDSFRACCKRASQGTLEAAPEDNSENRLLEKIDAFNAARFSGLSFDECMNEYNAAGQEGERERVVFQEINVKGRRKTRKAPIVARMDLNS